MIVPSALTQNKLQGRAMDSGAFSGTISEFEVGTSTDNKYLSILKISVINRPVSEFFDAMNSEPYTFLFAGNDEIYGTDFVSADADDNGYARDEAGNKFNGNRLHGFAGNDKVFGGKLIDSLWGDGGNDTIYGYDGDDFLFGGVGNDQLFGGGGSDKLNGGTGADMLYGALGNDILVGNSGSDKFVFDAVLNGSTNLDTIKDFVRGTDKIVLDDDIFTRFASKSSIASGNLITGTKALQLDDHLIYNTSNDTLYYDADGSGAQFGLVAFVKIELVGTAAPSATDFQVIA